MYLYQPAGGRAAASCPTRGQEPHVEPHSGGFISTRSIVNVRWQRQSTMQQQLLSYTALFGVSAIALGPTISPFLLAAVLLPGLLHLDYRSLLRVPPVVIAAHFAASLSTALPLLKSSTDAVALQAVWSVMATCGLLVPIAGRVYIAKKGNLKSGDWNELMLFPLLWTATLMIWQQVSPFGRLVSMSPMRADDHRVRRVLQLPTSL